MSVYIANNFKVTTLWSSVFSSFYSLLNCIFLFGITLFTAVFGILFLNCYPLLYFCYMFFFLPFFLSNMSESLETMSFCSHHVTWLLFFLLSFTFCFCVLFFCGCMSSYPFRLWSSYSHWTHDAGSFYCSFFPIFLLLIYILFSHNSVNNDGIGCVFLSRCQHSSINKMHLKKGKKKHPNIRTVSTVSIQMEGNWEE